MLKHKRHHSTACVYSWCWVRYINLLNLRENVEILRLQTQNFEIITKNDYSFLELKFIEDHLQKKLTFHKLCDLSLANKIVQICQYFIWTYLYTFNFHLHLVSFARETHMCRKAQVKKTPGNSPSCMTCML